MASSGVVKLAFVMWICMVVVVANAPRAMAIDSCIKLGSNLRPCLGYVKGSGGDVPPPACCNGIKTLNAAAKTTSDRQASCKCLKFIIGREKDINDGLVSSLPAKCGVNIPFPISHSMDCNKVQ